ncbi:MAG: hypothetical protein M0Q51_00500 [Bacteroidales bacterium]|nr:hypothetical protein [Bacteroidales bacterium]
MLIKFFRSSFLIQYFLLILVTAGIWIPGFFANQGLPVEPSLITPLYNLAHHLLKLFEAASPALAMVIILLSALTLNNILIFHDLTPKNDLLPAFLFIVLMGSNPLTLCTYPVVLSLPFFTWFLHTIFRINDEPENNMAVFNASILISVISMIYPAAIIIYACIWLILLVFGTFTGRNLIISFIALLLPYIYLFLYFFWTDQLGEALNAYRVYFFEIFHFRINFEIWQLCIWGIFIVFMLLPAFLRITGTLSTFSINFRKKMSATGWLLAFTFPIIIFHGQVDYNSLIFLPATIMIAHYYHLFKKSVWNEIALLIFLLLILTHNYLQLFNA